jgi:acyl-CoA thioesterase-1
VLVVLVTLLALLLGGCGSSPPAANQETPRDRSEAPSAKTPDDRGIVVAFGDSLTAGLGVPRGKSYPDFLQKEIDGRNLPFRVINEGVSGDTTDMGLARLSAVVARAPDFVVVEFGGNDGLRALPIDRMKENLRQMIQQLQESGAVVILAGMRLPPNYGPAYTSEFESAYVQLAQEMDIPFVRFLLEGVGGNPALMQEDGVHPTADGTKRVARNVFAILGPLLAEAEHSRLQAAP